MSGSSTPLWNYALMFALIAGLAAISPGILTVVYPSEADKEPTTFCARQLREGRSAAG
ncbi:hypothetical protein PR003_g27273 [Phytophthora rubi]|uniref:Uncharacterized protein n=1 Tax=Phytophthora rubi TaxID=129364 RepID=A0A6A4C1M0_9STRA|nr:hypothetical protein PR001_g23771 [Phytophthora rubi]KAE8991486.1 hypothetical protein PR002_g20835 [Phytophthora rubi]KAE9282917.1 hypothetical protein PR003_g27273 [Phytophthora rubi]